MTDPTGIKSVDLYQPRRPGPATLGLFGLLVIVWLCAGPLKLFDPAQSHWLLTAIDTWTGHPEGIALSALLHLSLFHLVMNCVGLLFFGSQLEHSVGGTRMVAVFVLSAIYGNLFSLIVPQAYGTVSLGASGGIMGLLGAHITIQIQKHGKPLALLEERSNRIISLVLLFLLVVESIALLQPILETQINHGAHLGGLLAGAFLGILLTAPDGDWTKNAVWLRIVLALFLLETGTYAVFPVANPRFNEILSRRALSNAKYHRADKLAEQALRLDRTSIGSHQILALSLEALGRLQESESHLRRLAEVESNGSSILSLAEFLHRNGRTTESLVVFEQAEEKLLEEIDKRQSDLVSSARTPSDLRAWIDRKNALAWLYASFGTKLVSAKSMVIEALANDPKNPHYLGTLGVIEYKRGKHESAIEHLTAAVSHHQSPRIRAHDMYYLAMALEGNRQSNTARETLSRAAEIDPRAPIRKTAELALSGNKP